MPWRIITLDGPMIPYAALRRRSPLAAAAALGLVPLTTGCDVALSPPRWETHWVVTANDSRIGVAALLPEGIALADGGGELTVTASSAPIALALGTLCPACVTLSGGTAAKPAFTATVEAATSFPTTIDSVTVTRGWIEVRLTNGTSFDPLRPSASADAPRGTFTVRVRAGTATLASRTISGAAKSLAPGTTLVDTVTFDATLLPRSVGSPVLTDVTIDSPAGDPVAIDAAQSLTLDVGHAAIAVNGVSVRVDGRTVESSPAPLDLTGLDAALVGRVERGSLLIVIENPLAISGTLTATISSPGGTVARSVDIAPGHSTHVVPFTGTELRGVIAASPATITLSGSVSAVPAGETVKVTPDMTIRIASQLELFLASEPQ